MSEPLEFRAHKRHPFTYVGAAFALIFIATGIAGIAATPAVSSVFVSVFALGFGTAILVSTAYAIWGRLRVSAGDDGWCTITWMLGPWSRSKRFPRADVRSVERYTSPRFAVMWPSIAGRQLRVEVHREGRPLDLGGGFQLDDASLQSIEDLLRAAR